MAPFRSAPILARYVAPSGLRRVASRLETALKLATVTIFVGLLVATFAWGVAEQRRADGWRQRAEALRAEAGTACERLERLGLTPASP